MNLNKFDKVPIYEQIIYEIEKEILSGILKCGGKMPSVRNLSLQLGVNPNTIQKAYTELERMGISISAQGQGRYVSEEALSLIRGKRMIMIDEIYENVLKLEAAGISFDDIILELKKKKEVEDDVKA